MLMDYLLVADSSFKVPGGTPNDFVIDLDRPIYMLESITLLSAKIRLTQNILNTTMNTILLSFDIDGYTPTGLTTDLTVGNLTGAEIAADITSRLLLLTPVTFRQYYDIDVFFNDNEKVFYATNKLYDATRAVPGNFKFTIKLGLANIMGWELENQSVDGSYTGKRRSILEGPDVLYVRLSDPNTDIVFNDNLPFQRSLNYSGVLLTTTDSDIIVQNEKDDPLAVCLYKGKYPELASLRIQILQHTGGGNFEPYDFRGRDNIFKFSIKCSLDKLNTLVDQSKDISVDELYKLPAPVELEYLDYSKRVNRRHYYPYAGMAVLIMVIFIFTTRSRHTPVVVA